MFRAQRTEHTVRTKRTLVHGSHNLARQKSHTKRKTSIHVRRHA